MNTPAQIRFLKFRKQYYPDFSFSWSSNFLKMEEQNRDIYRDYLRKLSNEQLLEEIEQTIFKSKLFMCRQEYQWRLAFNERLRSYDSKTYVCVV